MVPNGILVNNAAINAKTSAFLSYVLSHQDATGWLGPEVGTTKPRYLWGRSVGRFCCCSSSIYIGYRYPFMFGAIQMTEFNSSLTTPVVNALYKFVNLANTMLKSNNTGKSPHLNRKWDGLHSSRGGSLDGNTLVRADHKSLLASNQNLNREDFVITLQW